ncbi:hypothetical protein [Burkholderia gladioli]|uniref:hypothetical protein n=1 Tax=Burkholderia gladioli TaxID=28095 RepID=UPI0011B29B44|nr:hypothetical protein [Burkholderia gladioli]MBJ9660670.1 hypothetical protein [Burkholderia gladioli]MBU9171287.1 hypothetical protein [Burkholderia gladioli]MBU9217899.1 hypothetical protein [Burkholderia gladioli]MDN7725828.1 hypothetical protein [Burkholderia gladioli]
MKLFSAIDYQRQLIVASLDDFSPNATLPNYCGGQDGENPEIWRQAVVEFLCVNIELGFIEATHRPEIRAGCDVGKIESMLLNGDEAYGIDASVLWDVLYFNGTERLVDVVEKFNLRNWDCVNSEVECDGFVDFLKNAYGVG